MAFPFEFVIDGPPVSQQARRRELVRQWRRTVRNAAENHWQPGELPFAENVMISITYFYDTIPMDIDNIPKPILDELKGLVYLDDKQVTDVLCRKRELRGVIRVENSSIILHEAFNRGAHFLYILVERAPDQRVIY